MSYVQSVLGPVDPASLGISLIHEHLFSDLAAYLPHAYSALDRARQTAPLTDSNASWVRYNWHRNSDNMRMDDEGLLVDELRLFVAAGGGTVVDATTRDFGRDPLALQRVARRTGLNIVMGTGYYVADTHPPDLRDRSEESLAAEMIAEITDGVGESGVCAGIIGEVGTSWPLHPDERKVLSAAARAQIATGVAINVHPGRNKSSPDEILDVLESCGADLSRVVIGHVERTLQSHQMRIRSLRRGCYLAWDLAGTEISHYPLAPQIDMPNDGERLNQIARVADAGFADRVLISHDLSTKIRLSRFGGHGFAHIIENLVPLMIIKGFSPSLRNALLVENPKALLTLVRP